MVVGEAPFVGAVAMIIECVLMSQADRSHDGVLDGVDEIEGQGELATMLQVGKDGVGCLVGVDDGGLMISSDEHVLIVGYSGVVVDRTQRVEGTMLENVFD